MFRLLRRPERLRCRWILRGARVGDLDDMEKRQTIRALVMYSRSGFFYVDGRVRRAFITRRSTRSRSL